MQISACGLNCSDCNFLNNPCPGCYEVIGKTFWAKDHTPKGVCPLFDCSVNKKKLKHCGECQELPCKQFYDLKDPNISEQEHYESINKRVNNLRDLN